MPRPARAPSVTTAEVLRTEPLTPHLHRVVLGGAGLVDFQDRLDTDRYVKLIFAAPGTTLPEPLDLATVRAERPPEQRPRMRTYTVRRYDAEAGELTIDFVTHGDQGLAAPWALAARPGDRISFAGPGGGYAPDPTADWHLLVGDAAALPAIAAAFERLGPDDAVHAVLKVPDPADIDYLAHITSTAVVRWLVGDGPDADLVDAVSAMHFPAGRVHAFVHGELGDIRRLRTHLRDERSIPAQDLSISGYWRRGKDEDGFQAEKRAETQAGTPSAT